MGAAENSKGQSAGVRSGGEDLLALNSEDDHDRELIRRHLALSPLERLEALQSFVNDALRLRHGRPAQIR